MVRPVQADSSSPPLLRSTGAASFEDDGMGGRRRKKGLKEKIKEKLPGGHKDSQQNQAAATGGA
ncbi:unnamed protein product [Miscanthus lutarioriparius]|uniref:Dehydrin n=1 Tax=Miscanthus lutarioriparius TaxID=422564 RepID=A0A811QDS3_9POAL|nr:unnamed protein product [Miscanthus lutarioriparius]